MAPLDRGTITPCNRYTVKNLHHETVIPRKRYTVKPLHRKTGIYWQCYTVFHRDTYIEHIYKA